MITIREIVESNGPCCTKEERTAGKPEMADSNFCNEVVIADGVVMRWNPDAAPLSWLTSEDMTIRIRDARNPAGASNQEIVEPSCDVDLRAWGSDVNINCGRHLVVEKGIIKKMTRWISNLEFRAETCLEVDPDRSEGCTVRVRLAEGCQSLDRS